MTRDHLIKLLILSCITLILIILSVFSLQKMLDSIYQRMDVDIVMLGDSLTANMDWGAALGRPDIANTGLRGDTTDGFLNRLRHVLKLHPRICFVMGGINDIQRGIPVNGVFENYKKIIRRLKDNNIIPVIESTLYTLRPELNMEVEILDKLLKKHAEENNLDYIDLNSILSKDSILKNEYTYDGIHLTAKAYMLWKKEVEAVLRKRGLSKLGT